MHEPTDRIAKHIRNVSLPPYLKCFRVESSFKRFYVRGAGETDWSDWPSLVPSILTSGRD